MKLLIGIMHTIENEFEQCIDSINNQTYKDFDYFVVENLPNKDAHDKLYQTFMSKADKYNLFIKIDADMVLCRNTFFEEAVRKMTNEPDVDDLQIAVHDFYTNSLIFGLHVYRNHVSWKKNDEDIFVDMIENINKRVNDKKELAPAAYHCPNPGGFQSYHYGIHKAVKVMQLGNKQFYKFGSKFHWSNILKIKENFEQNNNMQLAFAVIGAKEAIQQKYRSDKVNYNNKYVKNKFDNIEKLPEEEIIHLGNQSAKYFNNSFLYKKILFSRALMKYRSFLLKN